MSSASLQNPHTDRFLPCIAQVTGMTSLQAASTVLVQVWDPRSCTVCNPHAHHRSYALIAHLDSPRSPTSPPLPGPCTQYSWTGQ